MSIVIKFVLLNSYVVNQVFGYILLSFLLTSLAHL